MKIAKIFHCQVSGEKKKQVDVTGLELKKLAADLDLVFI